MINGLAVQLAPGVALNAKTVIQMLAKLIEGNMRSIPYTFNDYYTDEKRGSERRLKLAKTIIDQFAMKKNHPSKKLEEDFTKLSRAARQGALEKMRELAAAALNHDPDLTVDTFPKESWQEFLDWVRIQSDPVPFEEDQHEQFEKDWKK